MSPNCAQNCILSSNLPSTSTTRWQVFLRLHTFTCYRQSSLRRSQNTRVCRLSTSLNTLSHPFILYGHACLCIAYLYWVDGKSTLNIKVTFHSILKATKYLRFACLHFPSKYVVVAEGTYYVFTSLCNFKPALSFT